LNQLLKSKYEMKNKVVLFDIDYTLFNAKAYREAFTDTIQQEIGFLDRKVFLEKAEEAYAECRGETGLFDPKLFLDLLSQKLHETLDIDALEKVIVNERIFNDSLYEDTLEVIQTLSKEKDIILGIFSAGFIRVQRPKIKLLEPFLHKEHIHIFEFRKGSALPQLLQQYHGEKLYLIDDIAEILYKAKQIDDNITTILIQRPNHPQRFRQVHPGFRPDIIIHTLREAVVVIKK